jgi:hypothetical protein
LPFSQRPKHSVVFHAGGTSMNTSASGVSIPPSSDDHNLIAIHSYLCKIKCDELKQKGLFWPSNDDDENVSTRFSSSGSDDDDTDSEDESSSIEPCRKSRRLCKKDNQNDGSGNTNKKKTHKKQSNVGNKNRSLSSITVAKKTRGRPRRGSPSNNSSTSSSANNSSSGNIAKKRKKNNKKTSVVKREIIRIDIPSTENGLIDIVNDVNITASIDYYLMTQIKLCSYERSNDTIAYLRQKALPEGYPGKKFLFYIFS